MATLNKKVKLKRAGVNRQKKWFSCTHKKELTIQFTIHNTQSSYLSAVSDRSPFHLKSDRVSGMEKNSDPAKEVGFQ